MQDWSHDHRRRSPAGIVVPLPVDLGVAHSLHVLKERRRRCQNPHLRGEGSPLPAGSPIVDFGYFDYHFDHTRESPRQDRRRSTNEFKNNHFTEMCSDSDAGSYLRLIDFLITQLQAQQKEKRR